MIEVKKIWNGLDHLVSQLASPTLFFSGGLGDVDFLRRLPLSPDVGPARVSITGEDKGSGFVRRQAEFLSPAGFLPEESRKARIEMILPSVPAGKVATDFPVFIHFAATGDETMFPRRLLIAEPLARKGIASIILENPYYGNRRPASQKDFVIPTVSDQFKMNQSTILEGLSLLSWLDGLGYQNTGVTGISMGGSMAASVAAVCPRPVSVAACIAPVGPGPAFAYGALSNRVDWEALAPELFEYFGETDSTTGSPESSVGARSMVSEGQVNQERSNPAAAKRKLYRLMAVADLRNYQAPRAPERAILVGANQDAYVPFRSVQALHQHWVGSNLRVLSGGHVSAVLLNGHHFRQAIQDVALAGSAWPQS